MPGTEDMEGWLDAAEVVYRQAVRLRTLDPRRMFNWNGPFTMAAGDVYGRKIRVSDDAELERRAAAAWSVHEDLVRDFAAEVGPKRAVRAYFDRFGLKPPQSTDELRRYGTLTWCRDGTQRPGWLCEVADFEAYKQRVLDTLTAGPGAAAVAGTIALARGGDREDWELGAQWGDLAATAGSIAGIFLPRLLRQQQPQTPPPRDRAVAAEVRQRDAPTVATPKERGVTRSSRGVRRTPNPAAAVEPERTPQAPRSPKRGRLRRAPTTPAPGRRPATPRRVPGSANVPIVEAAERARLPQAERNVFVTKLLGDQHELAREIGPARLRSWGRLPADQREAVIDHVAGAVLAERMTFAAPEFERARERAELIARRAQLPGRVQLLRGSTQALTGSRFEVAPGAAAPERQARRSSQLGDGFLGVVVNRPGGGKDLYVLVGVETKLASQVGELPAQLAKTHERLEGLGLRVGADVYVPAEHAKPNENRLFTATDLRQRMGWVVAAPRDARTEVGWRGLQRSCDRAVAQPAGSVTVVRLPVRNASLRAYARHLMDVLAEDAAEARSPSR